jgi:hypothetical protein
MELSTSGKGRRKGMVLARDTHVVSVVSVMSFSEDKYDNIVFTKLYVRYIDAFYISIIFCKHKYF